MSHIPLFTKIDCISDLQEGMRVFTDHYKKPGGSRGTITQINYKNSSNIAESIKIHWDDGSSHPCWANEGLIFSLWNE